MIQRRQAAACRSLLSSVLPVPAQTVPTPVAVGIQAVRNSPILLVLVLVLLLETSFLRGWGLEQEQEHEHEQEQESEKTQYERPQ